MEEYGPLFKMLRYKDWELGFFIYSITEDFGNPPETLDKVKLILSDMNRLISEFESRSGEKK